MSTLTKVFGVCFVGLVVSNLVSQPSTSTASPAPVKPVQATLTPEQQAERDDVLGVKCKDPQSKGSFIGEPQERTLKCGWGEPERVNRTTGQYGVHEQWVYGDGNYLYFKDGILTSMQTRE